MSTTATRYDREIGPRQVGGRYLSRYWGAEYVVLDIDQAAPTWGWTMTVRWEDGRETTHCTAWDRRDRVIAQPAH